MKHIAMLLSALSVACPAHAEESAAEAALAAVRDLGRVNGQALACGHADTAKWTRVLMLNHAPKTRRYGEAFEEGTQESFVTLSREPGQCPDGSAIATRLDEVTQKLRTALPAAPADK
jgi:hypothetical protein